MVRLAALDIGTNSVLMLAVESRPDGGVRPLLELARITRLGRGVERVGALDPEAARLTLDTITEFAAAARAVGAATIVAVATSVLRDASDGGAFIARVRERAGVEIEVISGRAEAELSHLAVMRGLGLKRGVRVLTVDIGGGSTELVAAEPGRELALVSLELGSVRLTERIVHHDPPSPAEIDELRATIDAALEDLKWSLRPDTLVGIAGTVTTVCTIALEMDLYDHSRVHGHVLSRCEVLRIVKQTGELSLAQRMKLKGLPQDRADIIFAGAMILERVMEHFAASSVIVSDQGVRWGLMWRELDRLAAKA
jgi:exopolyphosphatase / guanosine-5'-triphosphate,3'-diphosphate pyrophosphatase